MSVPPPGLARVVTAAIAAIAATATATGNRVAARLQLPLFLHSATLDQPSGDAKVLGLLKGRRIEIAQLKQPIKEGVRAALQQR